MEVLQGRYLKPVESGKGKLKGLQIETDEGVQTVYLPKSLRAIAQQELALGEPIRIWIETDEKSKKQKRLALQLIPLTPRSTVQVERLDRSKKAQTAKAQTAKAKTAKAPLTVQLCQKKNCCQRGGDDLWQDFAKRHAADQHSFKLEAVGCLGGCKRGPNIRLLPDNVKYRHVQPADINEILQRHGAHRSKTLAVP